MFHLLLLDYDAHRQMQDYVRELNRFYKENAPFWQGCFFLFRGGFGRPLGPGLSHQVKGGHGGHSKGDGLGEAVAGGLSVHLHGPQIAPVI